MKQKILVVLFLLPHIIFAQGFDKLAKLDRFDQKVYYSKDAKERAVKIVENVAKAEMYFQKEFGVEADYTLLVLSPTDWKQYAHPNAIYGIPHYLEDGRLVVASENNDFWKRNTPLIASLPDSLAQSMRDTYTDQDGEINLSNFFDLLAVHELAHAFQNAAGLLKQRSWLNELLSNVALHTFLAENNPRELPFVTVFTQVAVQSFPSDKLKYTRLEEFETYYSEIARNHPDNYGWYQCRFHGVAGEIYDQGGEVAMKKMWEALGSQKEILGDVELIDLLKNSHAALDRALTEWN